MKKYYLLFCSLFCLLIGNANAQPKDLHDFSGGNNGGSPYGDLIRIGNKLYGMTNGGVYYGNIFSINTNGTGYTNLLIFNDTNGAHPDGSLTLVGNKFFGMTYQGANGNGNIFSIDTNGKAYKDVFDFNVFNGEWPLYTTLTLSGNLLYGMTEWGGLNGYGVIFSIDTNGTGYKVLFNFNAPGGVQPFGSLTISGGTMFGLASGGGVSNQGTVFSIHTDGSNYKDLFSFNVITGTDPRGSLLLSGNKLYGMTYQGGINDFGLVFSIDTTGGAYKDMFDFDGAISGYPTGSLIRSGNLLYGMTSLPAAIFSIDTNGSGYSSSNYTISGSSPYGSLILSAGTLYGMTVSGGTNGHGVVFSDGICNLLKATSYSTVDTGSCNGLAAVTPSGLGPSPFTYLWNTGQTNDTIKGQCKGSYCCTITDYNGCKVTTCVNVTSNAGIENIEADDTKISVYPNPNSGKFHIELSVVSAQSTVEIYNMLGEKIYSTLLTATNTLIDLNTRVTGIYLFRIKSENGNLISSGKFIVQ
ncbi:MAG TPA: choice-of-anchor tandem repeat GloVer-containing protein [Bacteroidia bacterium]|nr:choice-of-anchor tandem repeat GloVer-containing protein [Bacteroidia bacterium]